MTLLAYDLDRLAALYVRMMRSAHELRGLRADDPAAADALRTVRLTADDLENTWLPLAKAVMLGNLMTARRPPAALGELDSSLAWVMANGYGWSVAADPLAAAGSTTAMTVESARALGVRLTGMDAATASEDPDLLRDLAAMLGGIAADQRLSREFLANFDGWVAWGDALARNRAWIVAGYPGIGHDVAAIDSVFEALSGIQRQAGAEAPTWIAQVEPYTAAAFARYLGLDGASLAVVTDAVLRRAADPAQRDLGTHDVLVGPAAGDLLLPLLVQDPDACRRYVELAAHHPDTLFAATTDRALAEQVVLRGTDPALMSVAEAEQVLPSVIRYFAGGSAPFDDHVFLADLVTPWTFQFAGAVTDWSLSRDERTQLLDFVVSDDAALNRLIDNSAAVLAGAQRSLGSHRTHRMAEFLSYVGMIGGITVNQRIQGVTRRRRAWDLMCSIASVGASLLPGALLGAAATIVVMNVEDAGPDLARAKRDQFYAMDLGQTMTAAAVMRTEADSLKREGLLPQDFPPTPLANPRPKIAGDLPSGEFFDAFSAWMDQLPGQWDGPLGIRMQAAVYAVLGPYTMGFHVGIRGSGKLIP